MHVPSLLAGSAAALCLAGSSYWAFSSASPAAFAAQGRGNDGFSSSVASDVPTRIVTLWARDPLEHSISLDDGYAGSLVREHKVWNRSSHLDFGGYRENELTAGIQGGDLAAWVDLGTRAELRERYGYEETIGNGQGFASIRRSENGLVILADYQAQTVQPLREAEGFVASPQAGAHVPVREDHVYLLRFSDGQAGADRYFKLLVLAFHPGESVTLRWAEIE